MLPQTRTLYSIFLDLVVNTVKWSKLFKTKPQVKTATTFGNEVMIMADYFHLGEYQHADYEMYGKGTQSTLLVMWLWGS